MNSFINSGPYFFLITLDILIFYLSLNQKRKVIKEISLIGEIGNKSQSVFDNFLNKIRYAAQINGSTSIYTEDPVNFLLPKTISEYRSTIAYLLGNQLTGISLIFTFLLIGWQVSEIGGTLTILTDSAKSSSAIANLGGQISVIANKFYISVIGILSQILITHTNKKNEKEITALTIEKCQILRKHAKLKDVLDLELKHENNLRTIEINNTLTKAFAEVKEQSIDFQKEIIETVRTIPQIEVSIKSLSDQLTQDLSQMLNIHVGERISELLEEQKNSTQYMAQKLSESLSQSLAPELNKIFETLGQKLPDIVTNGANSSTQEVGKIMEKVGAELPSLINSIQTITNNLQNEIKISQTTNQSTIDVLLKNMEILVSRFETMSRTAAEDGEKAVRKVQNVTESAANKLNEGIQHTNSFVENLAKNFQDFGLYNQELIQYNSKQITNMRDLMEQFNRSMQTFHEEKRQISNLVHNLGTIINNLEKLPSQTSESVTLMSNKIEELKNQTIDFENSYMEGISQIQRVYKDNIHEIYKQADALTRIYSDSAEKLEESFTPIEEIKEPIIELKEAILKLNLKGSL